MLKSRSGQLSIVAKRNVLELRARAEVSETFVGKLCMRER
jgi:hypothetical protein